MQIIGVRHGGESFQTTLPCYHSVIHNHSFREHSFAECYSLFPLTVMATTSLDSLYTQIDVFPTFSPPQPVSTPIATDNSTQLYGLLSEFISAQDRQTALLEELVASISHTQRRRIVELGLWKMSHPELAEYCKRAAKKLERVQTDLLSTVTEEIESNADVLLDSEYALSEFIDRFGTKFLQLNSLLQILIQLGNAPDLQITPKELHKDS